MLIRQFVEYQSKRTCMSISSIHKMLCFCKTSPIPYKLYVDNLVFNSG